MKALLLAVLGAATVAFFVGLIYLPAGGIVAGFELLAGAYVIRYLEMAKAAKR